MDVLAKASPGSAGARSTLEETAKSIERAYVAAAVAGAPLPSLADAADRAAAGAVASRYLAVGTPRTFGVVVTSPEDAALSLAAHRTWFAPRELRATGARVAGFSDATLAEVLACDIVCVHAPIVLRAGDLRRGTHVNALAAVRLDDDLAKLATVARPADLAGLAAGLVDGRQLDEITVFAV